MIMMRNNSRFWKTCKAAKNLPLLLTVASLAACGGGSQKSLVDPIEDLRGGAAADEPRAALIARDILAGGGTAADAMVGLYFGLSATMPHLAGLGGGGQCIAHNADEKMTDLVSFSSPPSKDQGISLPAAARGMAALWARYGKLQWGALVGPGENIASLGTDTSRALAKDLAKLGDKIAADPGLAKVYLGEDGTPLKDGARLFQPDLGVSLGQIRSRGGVEMNGGPLAVKYAQALSALGYQIDTTDLRAVQISISKPREFEIDDQILYVPDGEGAKQIEAILEKKELPADIAPPATTGAVTFDSEGNAVACIFTLNDTFGIGRLAPETGVTPAAPPSQQSIAPIIIANKHNGQFYFAGSTAGQKSIVQLVNLINETVSDHKELPAVMLELATKEGDDRINTAFCPKGSPSDPDSCQAGNDPRGNGLSILVGKAP